MVTKQDIRKQVLKKRDALSALKQQQYSERIQERLFSIPAFWEAQMIYFYHSFRSEVNTREMISRILEEHRRVALPRVQGDTMSFYEILDERELIPGSFGILEPSGEEAVAEYPDLILMPGAAFDLNRNRIGYGRGYYDRFLTRFPSVPRIALAYECQMIENIPSEQFDCRPDLIVTEARLIR